jgi:hypothetical protein
MNHTFNDNIISNSNKKGNNPVDQTFPLLTTSFSRMVKFFNNKCENQINSYSNCIENPTWIEDVTQFTEQKHRINCYSQWNSMKNCGNKYLGRPFMLKIDSSRQIFISDDEKNEERMKNYQRMMTNKLLFLKEDVPGYAQGDE